MVLSGVTHKAKRLWTDRGPKTCQQNQSS